MSVLNALPDPAEVQTAEYSAIYHLLGDIVGDIPATEQLAWAEAVLSEVIETATTMRTTLTTLKGKKS